MNQYANLTNYLKSNLTPEQIKKLKAKYGKSEEFDYTKYQSNPTGFVYEVLKGELWSKQAEILNALTAPRAKVSVKSCHASGKTATEAFAALWFLYSYPNSKVITTASKQEQLARSLWGYIRKLHAGANLAGECNKLSLTLAPDWFVLGQVAKDSTSFQSHHAPHILIIVDEAAGVQEDIFIGIDGLETSEDSRLLLCGNPTSSHGRFYDSHHSLRHIYNTISIGYRDTPNFTGEAVSDHLKRCLIAPAYVEEKRIEYGEDSPLWFAKLLGEFSNQSEDSLIPLVFVEAAQDLHEGQEERPIEFGVDCGRLGQSETVVVVRQGANILHLGAWSGKETTYTVGEVARLAREKFKPSIIRVDAHGVGGGPADQLRDLGFPAVDILVGGAAKDKERFCKLRDEIWWNLREKLKNREIGNLTDSVLQAQLTSIKYGYQNSKIKVESKDELLKRGVKSPDRADALCLAFWESSVHASAPVQKTNHRPMWFNERNVNPWR